MTVLIKGGTVVGPTGSSPMDVLIDGETVAALVRSRLLDAGRPRGSAERVIDATGKYVVPGGVDCHTHMELPFGGTFASDTFETGTRAAAWGGTTTIVDFAVQRFGERVQDGLAAWHAKAQGSARSTTPSTRSSVASTTSRSRRWTSSSTRASRASSCSWPTPASSTATTDRSCVRCRPRPDNGAMIMMHAENGTAIDVLVKQALSRGETAPINHGLTRPWETEEEATHRAIMLARLTGAPLYIVHMSAKQAVATLQAQRDQGLNVFGETCPQYLYLSLEEQLGAPGFEGAKWVCSTPLRSRAEGHQDALWTYLGPTTCRSSARTTARSASRSRRSSGSATSPRFPTESGRSSTGWT